MIFSCVNFKKKITVRGCLFFFFTLSHFSAPELKAQVHYCDHSWCVVRPSLTFYIFDFFETSEPNSAKLDRKQDLNVLYQVCVFWADRKNKMAVLASLLWNHWTEFKENWQKGRSQCPLPSLCFSYICIPCCKRKIRDRQKPLHPQKNPKKQHDNTKMPQKLQLHNDCGPT